MNIKFALQKLIKSIDPDQKLILIADLGTVLSDSEFPIVLSIVNIAENAQINQQFPIANSQTNSSQQLVVSLLFTAFGTDYLNGIDSLQYVINYLQQHAVFDDFDLPIMQNSAQNPAEIRNGNQRFTVQFVSLNFEEQAQLWSCLGVNYRPSALYQLIFSN